MSADWLNGIGLVYNIIGVVTIFFSGVPRYRSLDDAGTSALLLERGDPSERARTVRAAWLSAAGLALLGVGFALQLAAILAY
jgi:hypothetical protein